MAASGELAGYYRPQGAPTARIGPGSGFEMGRFTRISFPGSVDTCFFNINERGDLVGRYIANGVEHGLYIERLGRRPRTAGDIGNKLVQRHG